METYNKITKMYETLYYFLNPLIDVHNRKSFFDRTS